MKFSERKGFTQISKLIQRDYITPDLRSSLWNVLDIFVWSYEGFLDDRNSRLPNVEDLCKRLYIQYFKKPIDTLPLYPRKKLDVLRDYFFKCQWFALYDFLEEILNILTNVDLNNAINSILEKELSAYRYVGDLFTDITDEQEISMLDEAMENNEFPNVTLHLRTALERYSDKNNPDYRNSIKESISAVECMARYITSNEKATLGEALQTIERKGLIHSALKDGFNKIYGYTSDEGGIRHAFGLFEKTQPTASDAKFFLLSCTSFINYLKTKM
jgi:hypothetical protein